MKFEEVSPLPLPPSVPYIEPSDESSYREACAINGADSFLSLLASFFLVPLLNDKRIQLRKVLLGEPVHRSLQAEPYHEKQADHQRSRIVLCWPPPVIRVGCLWCLSCIDELSCSPYELSILLLLPVLVIAPLAFLYYPLQDEEMKWKRTDIKVT